MGGNELNYPADVKATSQNQYDGKPLLKGKIKQKTNLNVVLKMYGDILEALDDYISLTELDSAYFNLEKFSEEGKSKIAFLFNTMGKTLAEISKAVGSLSGILEDGDQGIADALYTIKTFKDDTTPGYLVDKLVSEQTGALKKVADKLMMIGVVPEGAIFFIGKDKLLHFDNAGKGMQNTPYWGYAICNGANGTINYLSESYLKLPGTPSKASTETGRDKFSVIAKNIAGMEMSITGNISEYNGNGSVQIPLKTKTVNLPATGGGNQVVIYAPDGNSASLAASFSIAHTHSHTLKSKLENAAIEEIDLNPKAVYLIPITKINV